MKRLCRNLIMAVMVPFCISASENWNINVERDGSIKISLKENEASMPYEVIITVNKRIKPGSIQIRFPDGEQTRGTDGELHYYWIDCKGINAVWKHLRTVNKLEILSLQKINLENAIHSIPYAWFGNMVACVTNRGEHFVGRLTGTLSSYGWFSIEIEGAEEPHRFYVGAVKELHKLL